MTNGKKFYLLIKQPCNSLVTLLNIGIKRKERPVRCTSEDYIRNYGGRVGRLFMKGKASLFCFRQIMNIEIYAEIFCTRASEISWMLCGRLSVFPTREITMHNSHFFKLSLKENSSEVSGWS